MVARGAIPFKVKEPAMVAVSVGEFTERTDELLRRVRETGEPVEIVDGGLTIARLVPNHDVESTVEADRDAFWDEWRRLSQEADRRQVAEDARTLAIWADLRRLSVEIGKKWPQGVSAVDAVRDVRRDF